MTKPSTDDAGLLALIKQELFTAVIGDVLDQMGPTRQFLPAGIAPLTPTHVLAGRAMPVLERVHRPPADPQTRARLRTSVTQSPQPKSRAAAKSPVSNRGHSTFSHEIWPRSCTPKNRTRGRNHLETLQAAMIDAARRGRCVMVRP
jgi:hypothetical protein